MVKDAEAGELRCLETDGDEPCEAYKRLKARTIDRCAEEIREILKDEYGAKRLDEIVNCIRAMKDKP